MLQNESIMKAEDSSVIKLNSVKILFSLLLSAVKSKLLLNIKCLLTEEVAAHKSRSPAIPVYKI